jgi:hypothetical protein
MNAPEKIITDVFCRIPETTLPTGQIVPAFDIGAYLSSKGTDGKVAINETGTPWNRINYHDSAKASEASGYALTTDLQSLAVSFHIAADARNWSGGKVGEGKLFRGIHSWRVSGPQPATVEPTGSDKRRFHYLPDGQKIYDWSGNLWEWLRATIGADESGVLNCPFAADDPRLVIAYPGEDKAQGFGPTAGRDWSGSSLVRGGRWCSGSDAGVFALSGFGPGWTSDGVGFRCTKPAGL